jgi:hypothetical protein
MLCVPNTSPLYNSSQHAPEKRKSDTSSAIESCAAFPFFFTLLGITPRAVRLPSRAIPWEPAIAFPSPRVLVESNLVLRRVFWAADDPDDDVF